MSSVLSFLKSRQDGLIVFGLIAFSLLFYARATQFGFVSFDDPTVLLAHPSLYDETSFISGVRAIFSEFPREEPLLLRDLTWAADARIYGLNNPFGFHLGNIVLNAIVVGLLFVLLRRWTRSSVLAGVVSLAFAVVPVHVEPVSWVMGRKDMLVAVMMLLGLLCQSIALDSEKSRWRALAYAGTLFFCVLALGSKISAIAFPIVLGVHRFFYPYLEEGKEPSAPIHWRASFFRTLPPILPHIFLSLLVFGWYRGVLDAYGGVFRSDGPTGLDPEHLMNMARFLPLIAAEYLKSLFLPYEWSVSYRWPSVGIALSPIEVMASCAWALAIGVAIGFVLWKRRDLAFYGFLTLALLSPYIGLFYVGFWRADRYLYLASAGLLVIAGVLIRDLVRLVPAVRVPAVAFVSAFLVLSATANWFQQEHWRTNTALWSYEIERREPSLLAFHKLAAEYANRSIDAKTYEERGKLIAVAEEIVKQAFVRVEELDFIETPYGLPERQDLARMYDVEMIAAIHRDAPVTEQVQILRKLYGIEPTSENAWRVARMLYAAAETGAEETREQYAGESLSYYEQLLILSTSDSDQLKMNLALLESHYASHFEFLEERVSVLRNKYTQ